MHLVRNPSADQELTSPDALRTLERVKQGAIIYATHEEDQGVVYWLKATPETEDSIGVTPKTVRQLVDAGVLVFLGAEEAGFVDNPLRIYGSRAQLTYQKLRALLARCCQEFCDAANDRAGNTHWGTRGLDHAAPADAPSIAAALAKWSADLEHYAATPFDFAGCVMATLKQAIGSYQKRRIALATLCEIAATVGAFYAEATSPSHAELMSTLGNLLDRRTLE